MLTGFTLVLALVITRLLGGLRWALDPERAYWVHSLHVLTLLALTSLIWWGLWYSRDTAWSYLAFAYNLLIGPGIVYFAATVLIPDNPRRIRDWREHFYRTHRMYFGAFAAMIFLLFLGSLLFAETPLFHFTRLLQAAALVVCLIGMRSRAHSVQGALSIFLLMLVATAMVYSEQVSGGPAFADR